MYTTFPNHTTIIVEVTQNKIQIDLSAWLKYDDKKTDFVILRIESKEDIAILTHLTNTNAIEHADKCYTAPDIDDHKEMQTTMDQFNIKAEIWDNALQTYSAFDELNPMHIPTLGKSITIGKHAIDEQICALFLYSLSASINTL